MAEKKNPYHHPYKFRLWLDTIDHRILNSRQKRLLLHILAWGPSGCDSWNYRLAKVMRCSIRTIRRDLRVLEHYCFIDNRGALGKYRRIVALPWRSKRIWKAKSLEIKLSGVGVSRPPGGGTKTHRVTSRGDKFVPHQRRLNTSYLNMAQEAQRQKNQLLYESAESALRADAPSSGGDTPPNPPSPRGDTPRTPRRFSGAGDKLLDIARQRLIGTFIALGYDRDRAIRLAEARISQQYERWKAKSS